MSVGGGCCQMAETFCWHASGKGRRAYLSTLCLWQFSESPHLPLDHGLLLARVLSAPQDKSSAFANQVPSVRDKHTRSKHCRSVNSEPCFLSSQFSCPKPTTAQFAGHDARMIVSIISAILIKGTTHMHNPTTFCRRARSTPRPVSTLFIGFSCDESQLKGGLTSNEIPNITTTSSGATKRIAMITIEVLMVRPQATSASAGRGPCEVPRKVRMLKCTNFPPCPSPTGFCVKTSMLTLLMDHC